MKGKNIALFLAIGVPEGKVLSKLRDRKNGKKKKKKK